MSSAPPKFLYFDLGNVIIHFDHDRMCRQIAEVAGLSAQQVRAVIFESPMLRMIEIGELTNESWHRKFCEVTNSTCQLAPLLHAASDIFWLNHEIVPVLTQLAAASWRMGILSNTSQAHWEFLADDRFGAVPALFEQVVLSYDVHAMKPEPEIFAIAAQRAGCRPDEIFYTDDRDENVDGARRAGFDAERFTGAASLAKQLRSRGVTFNY